MKIITPPYRDTATTDRAAWIHAFSEALTARGAASPEEIPTGLRDMGRNVRFRWPNGATIEWVWEEVAPEFAAEETHASGLLT